VRSSEVTSSLYSQAEVAEEKKQAEERWGKGNRAQVLKRELLMPRPSNVPQTTVLATPPIKPVEAKAQPKN